MNEFDRCNKVTGVHWLKSPIENIKIKIKLKPKDGIITLPKFEDYINDSSNITLQQLDTQNVDEYTFNWQEKVFSLWELQRYSDIHNCISDVELDYHDMLKDLEHEPRKIFTYIHEDYSLPLPSDFKKKTNSESGILNLNSCLQRLKLDKIVKISEDTNSIAHLFRSEENISMENEQWIAMHIVFDNSDYNEDQQLISKQEAILLSIYHNISQNYLIISPDVNNLDLNPYQVETSTGVPLSFQYAVEVEFEKGESGEELVTLLRKLYKKWEKKNKQLISFAMPPLGRKQFYLSMEIISAIQFEMDDLYIEFTIKVPKVMHCNDSLHGRTHTSRVLRSDEKEQWNFGHIIELCVEVDANSDPPPIQFFFEVISTDWWERHRTEGYSYLALRLDPGSYGKQLSCSRPEELDRVVAESRRFFVGGCHLIKDLSVLVKPQEQDANFRYVTTGQLKLRWNVISQTHVPGTIAKLPEYGGTSSASALLLGAEAALRKYRKARAKLAAATKDLAEKKIKTEEDNIEKAEETISE